MKKLFTSSLVFLAGAVLPSSVSPKQTPKTTTPDYRKDPRFELLRRFFQKIDAPAQHYSHTFLEAADAYALDWRLLPSISFIESTGGKAGRNNNFFGWGQARFSSPSAGIHEVGYRLSHSSLYKRKDLDTLLSTYNPEAEYARRVKSVMRRIAPVQ